MKIIKKQNWQTLFLEEQNFLLKTEKAYFVSIPLKDKPGKFGIWIAEKFGDYGTISKTTNKPYYAIAINKEMPYKLTTYNLESKNNKTDYIISKDFEEVTGAQLLELFFGKK